MQSGRARQGARPSRISSADARRPHHGDAAPDLGDASFAGQGVIAECFGLSGLRGHRPAARCIFIVHNQIGSHLSALQPSSPYPSDVADDRGADLPRQRRDPEAVVFAAKIATEFRQKFQKPVVIDMFCYRRHGHNEGTSPRSPSR